MKSSSTSFFYGIGCLILFQVVVLSTANAQGCNLKTGVLAFACTEGTSLSYEDGIDCYSEIRMILDAGTFYEWTANAADGWIVEQVAPSELLVTHMNGTFPSGDHTMVDFLYYTTGGAPAQLILLYPDECILEGCENQHMLPGCGEGCITGTVYRECADEPFSNQLTLDGFLVELFDEMGNIISEYTTGSDGAYSTCNLPPGNYVVRATRDPGWTPKIPATGEYVVELTPGMDLVRDFGSCPSCTCDDLEIILQQEVTENDTAFLNLYLYYSKYTPCVFRYELSLDSGEIIGMEHIPDGWEAEIINPQLAVLQQSESFDDWTTFVFHRWRVAIDYGIKEKGIKATVRLIGDGNQPPEPVCIDSIIIEDPTKFKQLTCCPEGSILGAELVLNGEFLVVQAPTSDYSYLPYPNYPGEIAIVNHVTSPYWLQISKNGGPFDRFLAVNGSTNPGQVVWKQQVTGLLGEKDYNFCGLFNNLFKSNLNADDPVIELVIQDDISSFKWSSGLILLPENPDIWEKLSVAWTTPAVTSPSYTLKILSHGTNPFGNDFGVDCISFRECIDPLQDTCICNGFTDMFIRTPQGAMNIAVICGDPPLTIACPAPGKGFHLTGVFDCIGGACPSDHQIDWTLTHLSSGTTYSGGFQDNDPYFGIHILPTYISQPGIYTLTMTGYCNGDTCVCEVQFVIDCPDLCPCDMEDILALSANVDKGFAVALANKSCKACFSPLAVSDCETVEWYVGSTSGTPIGTSIGAQTFCYTFPLSGTYTIYMVVTRLKPDGTLCEAFVYSKTISVSCIKWPVCLESVFPNPGFGAGAIAGNMNMEGEALGWIGEGDNPTVLEGVLESEDAWSILLTGCYFNSDLLTSADPVCLSKTDTGTITIRLRTPGDPLPGIPVLVGRKPPGGNNIIIGYGINLNQQAGHQRLAIIEDLLPLEDDDWYDVYIPYDLKNLESADSCGDLSSGLPGHLGIWMSNMLSSDQGDGLVRDAVIIDHICMGGTLVGTDNPPSSVGYRLFPNPTLEAFRIALPNPARPNTSMHVIGLTGQILLYQLIPEGVLDHVVNASSLAPGMYFVEVIQNGKKAAVFKVVKQ